VFCQLELLRQCFPQSVRYILKELPDSLDETYERILKEIPKPNQRHARQLLHCLVAAARPLEAEELAEILAFDFSAEGIPKLIPGWRWKDQEAAVMSACSSLVTIVNDGDSRIVQFSHYSVKEFLTADRLAEHDRDVSCYHIRLEAAHTIFAQACLGVLLQFGDRVDRDNIHNFPLAGYAAQYWATHAQFENASSHVKDGMERLFDADEPHFATWLWIYNEDVEDSMPTAHPEKPEVVPLYFAARLGFRELAEHLIANHPELVNAKGGKEVTSMHAAARAGHTDILSLLLEHGADVDGQGMFGQTPLHRAAWSGKLEIGRCLLDHDANIHAQDDEDWTPLFTAVFKGHVEFARMLLAHGAKSRINDHEVSEGLTPLHVAVKWGSIQAVRLLVEHGADVKARDHSGQIPFQQASVLNRHDVMELLSKHGAKSVKVLNL
jgi:ankyrin repeat protein